MFYKGIFQRQLQVHFYSHIINSFIRINNTYLEFLMLKIVLGLLGSLKLEWLVVNITGILKTHLNFVNHISRHCASQLCQNEMLI